MKHILRYGIAAAVALVLTIACVVASVVSLPEILRQEEPADAVSVMDQVSFEYGDCEPDENGGFVQTGGDPQVYIYGITGEVNTLCICLAKPLPTSVSCQLYYMPAGVSISEDNSIKQVTSAGQTELYFTMGQDSYESFRLDIDGDYQLEDILVSQEIPTTYYVDKLAAPMQLVNWVQAGITFVLLLGQALLVAWRWEILAAWFAGRRDAFRENRKQFWISLGLFAASVALGLGVWVVLCAAGVLTASFFTGFFFVMAGCVLGAFLALRHQLGKHPERVFLLLTLCVGLVYAFLLPKATIVSLDDESHYKQALRLSYGGTVYYTDADYAMQYQQLSTDTGLEAERGRIRQLNEMYEEGSSSVEQTSVLSLSKLPYLPSAAGMWMARSLGLSFSAIFVAGRVGNLLCYALVLYFAIKRLRRGGMLMAVFALLPLLIFTAGNYSYDGWCVAFFALGMSIFLDEYRHPEWAFDWPTMIGMLVCFALGCIPKAIYFPIFLIALFVPKEKFASRRQRQLYCLAVVGAAGLMALSFALPFLVSKGAAYTDNRGGSGINSGEQVKFILKNPLTYAKVLLGYLFTVYFTPSFIMQFSVNSQGYMEPFRFGVVLVILLALVFVFERPRRDLALHQPSVGVKLASVVAFFCAVCLAATAMYAAFTAVGSGTIQGCQSRYMLPVLLPMLMVLRPNRVAIHIPLRYYHLAVLGVEAVVLFVGLWPLMASYV